MTANNTIKTHENKTIKPQKEDRKSFDIRGIIHRKTLAGVFLCT